MVDALRRQLSEAEEGRKKAEQALRNLEHRNRLLGDSAPFGILTADITGRITGSNRKIQEMLPWPTGQDLTSFDLFGFKPLVEAGIVEELRRSIEIKNPSFPNAFASPHMEKAVT